MEPIPFFFQAANLSCFTFIRNLLKKALQLIVEFFRIFLMAQDYSFILEATNLPSASGSPAPFPPNIPSNFYNVTTNLMGKDLPTGSAFLIRSLNINFYITYDVGLPDWSGSVPYWALFGTNSNTTTKPIYVYSTAMGEFTNFITNTTASSKNVFAQTIKLVDANAPICINNPGTGESTSLVVQFVGGSTSATTTPYFSNVTVSMEGILFQSTDNFNVQSNLVSVTGGSIQPFIPISGLLKRNLLSVYVVNFNNSGLFNNPTASFILYNADGSNVSKPIGIRQPLTDLQTGIYVDKNHPWILQNGEGLTIQPRNLGSQVALAHATYIFTES